MTPLAGPPLAAILAVGFGFNDAIVVAVALIVGCFTLVRGRADIWKSNFDAEKERADRLQKELAEAQTRVAALESLPTVEKVVEMLASHGDMLISHEQRETAGWERITLLLEQMTAQLRVLDGKVEGLAK